jgi:hypothetical protein
MFGIGERVLLLAPPREFLRDNSVRAHVYNGTEVTVVSTLIPYSQARGGHIYVVRGDDGYEFGAIPEVLHKLPPPRPREDLRVVSWDHCVWRPASVPAAV